MPNQRRPLPLVCWSRRGGRWNLKVSMEWSALIGVWNTGCRTWTASTLLNNKIESLLEVLPCTFRILLQMYAPHQNKTSHDSRDVLFEVIFLEHLLRFSYSNLRHVNHEKEKSFPWVLFSFQNFHMTKIYLDIKNYDNRIKNSGVDQNIVLLYSWY